MPATYVQSVGGFNATSSATYTMALTVGAKSLLVFAGGLNSSTVTINAPTDTQGNTWLPVGANVANSSCKMAMFYTITASAGSLTVTANASGAVTIAAGLTREYTGITPTSPLDKNANATGSVVGATTAATATTAQADELVVCTFGSVSGTGTLTAGTGYGNLATRLGVSSNMLVGACDKNVATTGTQTGAMTWSTARTWAGIVATFTAGSGAVPGASGQHFPFLGHHDRQDSGLYTPDKPAGLWTPGRAAQRRPRVLDCGRRAAKVLTTA